MSKKSKSSFYYTFSLLPSNKRDAMNTIYAFCRKTDDIADDESITRETKQKRLNNWRENLKIALNNKSEIELLNELNNCIVEFNIPHEPFFELIEGMEIDLIKDRFNTFKDLEEYCYKAASTVGLMTIPVFGYKHKSAIDYAINLGIALQLTNIIRDVKTDSLRGRIYIPLEDLEQFGYTEEELFNGNYNEQFIELMKFQTKRARYYYDIANKNLNPEDKKSMFTARAMQYIYSRLLDKIEEENFNIFNKKIRVSNFNKIFIALSVWLKYKLLG
ncbi:MAG: presqualene diphosphate synthase HpnD [Melioribacteraceae bacterium]|nr:presqualene diphosphate synthase HpnD [Melioribacteraceae bacterium]